jgi:FkbM family methyltransferase
MRSLVLPDDHDLCVRLFLEEIDTAIEKDKTGVVHVGAHMGEEVPAYRDFGWSPMYLIEANPEVVPALSAKFDGQNDVSVLPIAVGDREGEIDFAVHKTKKGGMESASILPLWKLGEIVPVFSSDSVHKVPISTIDLLSSSGAFTEKVGLVVIDVQGAELLVLKGAKQFLQTVDAVICEVNLIENYKGCALEQEIVEYMEALGFYGRLAIYHELYDASGTFPAWGERLWLRQPPK